MERLIIFVKAPRPGVVKTRLGQVIGLERSAVVYRRLVDMLVDHVRTLADVELRFSPGDGLEDIRQWLQPTWTACHQGDGTLGERMRRAFQTAFASGHERVVLIGSDCPDVKTSDVIEAWRELSLADVVLGPARDGGYWLIGLRRDQPSLFDNMTWSTAAVLEETLRRCRQTGLSVHQLRWLEDVDTADDWARFEARR